MNSMNKEKCSAKVPATCRNHGWIKRPITSAEAKQNLDMLNDRMRTASGRGPFENIDKQRSKAAKIYDTTPEGQKDLKNRLHLAKQHGLPTVLIKQRIAEAKFARANEEREYNMFVFEEELLLAEQPAMQSPKGQELLKKLEKLKGEPVTSETWVEAKQETNTHLIEQDRRRYNKSFENRLSADLKETALIKKQVSQKRSNEYYLKNSQGEKIAIFKTTPTGDFVEATVPQQANDGSLNRFSDGLKFRAWVEKNQKSVPLPEWFTR